MSTPAEIPPPVNPSDPGRGPWIVAVTWVFTIIAAITTGLWCYSRRKRKLSPGWDCWLMVIALIIRVAFQCTITYSLTYGLGKHDLDLWPWELVQILKYNWIALPGAVVTSSLARISITILLIRLFGIHTWFKWFLIVVTLIQVVAGIVLIPITFAQATPVEALWDFSIIDATRWDPRVWAYTAYFTQSSNTFSDLTYVAFPVWFIWRLQMPLRNRLGLIALMCLSLVTMVMSILKTYYIAAAANATQASTDVQYDAAFQVLFGVLEQDFVIIMGCIPSLRKTITVDMKRLNALGSSINSLIRGTRSKPANSTAYSGPSTGAYHDLENRSFKMSRSSRSGASTDSRGPIATPYPQFGSQANLTVDKQPESTDHNTAPNAQLPRGYA